MALHCSFHHDGNLQQIAQSPVELHTQGMRWADYLKSRGAFYGKLHCSQDNHGHAESKSGHAKTLIHETWKQSIWYTCSQQMGYMKFNWTPKQSSCLKAQIGSYSELQNF